MSDGRGANKDLAEAAKWLAKSAEQGHIIGQRIVSNVKTEQAQIASKLSKVPVGNELCDPALL